MFTSKANISLGPYRPTCASRKRPGKACAMGEDVSGVGLFSPRSEHPQPAMKTSWVANVADRRWHQGKLAPKLRLNCRAAFPGHLRNRNAEHVRGFPAGVVGRCGPSYFFGGGLSSFPWQNLGKKNRLIRRPLIFELEWISFFFSLERSNCWQLP